MLRKITLVFAGLAIVLAFWPEPPPDKSILFIGNSFTYGGNVPLQVKNIAATSDHPVKYFVDMHVRGGTTLAQHVSETGAIAAIESRDWDTVVLQDQSSVAFLSFRKEMRDEAAIALAQAAQSQGAEVIYYAHWSPNRLYLDRREGVQKIENRYLDLSFRGGGQVATVGRLWQMAYDAGVEGLYASDDHHASVKGAYVAALAISAALGDVDPKTSEWAPDKVVSSEQELLRSLTGKLAEPEPAALE